jgi:hypothetical protein
MFALVENNISEGKFFLKFRAQLIELKKSFSHISDEMLGEILSASSLHFLSFQGLGIVLKVELGGWIEGKTFPLAPIHTHEYYIRYFGMSFFKFSHSLFPCKKFTPCQVLVTHS